MIDFQVKLLMNLIASELGNENNLDVHKDDDSVFVWHKDVASLPGPHYGYGVKFNKDDNGEFVTFNVLPYVDDRPDKKYAGKDWIIKNSLMKNAPKNWEGKLAKEIVKTIKTQMDYR